MYSSHQKEVPTPNQLPCPECGYSGMANVVESCTLVDGTIIKKLRHLKCSNCGERFFDDRAMHEIQAVRAVVGHV